MSWRLAAVKYGIYEVKMNHHGGQIKGDGFTDYSVNIPKIEFDKTFKDLVMNSIETLHDYPEIDGITAKRALAEYLGVDIEEIIIGNGATELIYLTARALKLNKLMILQPTFTEYARAFSMVDTELIHYYLKASHSTFGIDFDDLASQINKTACEALMLCNPNNPTGTLFTDDQLIAFLNKVKISNFLLMIDESFIEFYKSHSSMAQLMKTGRVLVIRSMTKTYRVPGLRIGYMIGPKQVMKSIQKFKEPWSLNSIALKSIPYFLGETRYLENLREWCLMERNFLYKQLSLIKDLKVFQSYANFLLLRYEGDDVKGFFEAIEKECMHVRTCHDFMGLDKRFFRISVQDRITNQLFLEKINKILGR